MGIDRVKVFKDTVHGYIEIPSVIVSNIIDTEQFQRLRYIEQTSMRSLYPAARHDRFIHSLGVYYLGKQAFNGFENNSRKVIESLKTKLPNNIYNIINKDEWWNRQRLLFEIACLMHDCAHAPFSHTLEQYYHLKTNSDGIPKLIELLTECCDSLGDSSFKTDLYSAEKSTWIGAPHEQLSSYIILKEYRTAIKTIFETLLPDSIIYEDDYVFICRMILGCRYLDTDVVASLKNCIISLLNSSTIDVDGLDYIVRDAQMSGVSAYSIDYQRILNSFTILPVQSVNKYVENINITGLWLEKSCFGISNLSGRLCGEFTAKGSSLSNSIFVESDTKDVIKTNELIHTKSYKSVVEIKEAKDGDLQLRSTSKFVGAMFSGMINGKKIVESEDELNANLSFVLGYDKRCLSVIQNTLDARNNEYLWIYTHPKVLYNSNFLQCKLLDMAAEYLSEKLINESEDEFLIINELDCITQLLGYQEFFDDTDIRICSKLNEMGYYFYRSNDNDINALFKRIYLEIKGENNKSNTAIEYVCLYEDYYSRKQRKLFWKSFMEKEVCSDYCNRYFDGFDGISKFLSSISDAPISDNKPYKIICSPELEVFKKHGFEDVLVIYSTAKIKAITFPDFFVKYGDKNVRLCDILDSNMINIGLEKKVEYIFFNGNVKIDNKIIADINNELNEIYLNDRKNELMGLKNQ